MRILGMPEKRLSWFWAVSVQRMQKHFQYTKELLSYLPVLYQSIMSLLEDKMLKEDKRR